MSWRAVAELTTFAPAEPLARVVVLAGAQADRVGAATRRDALRCLFQA